jgi:hypothetical protein
MSSFARGHGDKAQSWIASGPNKSVSPSELERARGPEKIAWLMDQTGLSREELLAGLSRELPNAVDQLTGWPATYSTGSGPADLNSRDQIKFKRDVMRRAAIPARGCCLECANWNSPLKSL